MKDPGNLKLNEQQEACGWQDPGKEDSDEEARLTLPLSESRRTLML